MAKFQLLKNQGRNNVKSTIHILQDLDPDKKNKNL